MKEDNQQSQSPQPLNSLAPIVNSSRSKLIPIILSIVVAIIIAIGAYALGSKQIQPVVQNSIQTTPIPSPTPIDETANWKTYINKEYAFSIKYPPPVLIEEYSKKRETAAPVIRMATNDINSDTLLSLGISNTYPTMENTIDVKIYQDNLNKTIKYAHTRSSYSVDNTQGEKLITIMKTSDGEYGHANVIIIRNKKQYWFLTPFEPKSKDKELQIFDQILSTFKFIEQPTLPTACKDEPEGTPVITSISPASGSVGTEVEIKGCNFAGFEGDLDVIFVRSDGATLPFYGGTWNPNDPNGKTKYAKIMKIIVNSYCESGSITGRYSGITSPCKIIKATPGIYRVYVTAWEKKSNEVTFTITE